MDFRHPLWGLTPTLEGEALELLCRADAEYSGRQVHKMIGRGSEEGVRQALNRLAREGIVLSRRAGRATLYSFNREHLAAPSIEDLMGLRAKLFERLRAAIAQWRIQPVAAAVFGSVARGEAGPESDLDIFLLRPAGTDDDEWATQVAALAEAATRWTGNDTRPFEVDEETLSDLTDESVIRDIRDHGIEIGGSLRALRHTRSR